MHDLASVLWEAWQRVRPRLLADREELRRRLARRKTMALRRPPRAWCLALRAGDTRLAGWGCRDVCGDSEGAGESARQQDVFLDADLLRRLCEPVRLEPPGETMHEVAAKLGVTIGCLNTARRKGILRTHHVPGLGGQHGHPVPLL